MTPEQRQAVELVFLEILRIRRPDRTWTIDRPDAGERSPKGPPPSKEAAPRRSGAKT